MKKTKYLSLLVLPLLLVACGETSSTPTPSSSEPTTSESATQKEVEEKVGTFGLLKGVLSSYEGVSKVVTTSVEGETTTTDTFTIRTREVLQTSVSGDETTTIYNGYVNGVQYYASIDSTSPWIERTKVYADGTEGLGWSDKTESQVLEQLNKTIKSASNVTSGIWANLFTAEEELSYGTIGTKITSYSATSKDNEIEIRAKGYENQYKTAYGDNGVEQTFNGSNEYTFVAYLDSNYVLKSGTLNCKFYNLENCDASTKLPLSTATATSTSSYSVTSFEAGNRETTSTTPLLDLSSYFMTSITNEAYYKVMIDYDDNWNPIYGNVNEAFLGSTIESYNIKTYETNDEWEMTDKYFLPATAQDYDDFEIISSSSPAITKDEYGSWTVTSDTSYIGTSVTLTLGNDFVSNLGTVTITIAQDPNASSSGGSSTEESRLPTIDWDSFPTPEILMGDGGTITTEDGFTTITLQKSSTYYLAFNSTTEYPLLGFTDYSEVYGIINMNESLSTIAIDYETGSGASFNGLVFSITTGETAGEAMFGITKDGNTMEDLVGSYTIVIE